MQCKQKEPIHPYLRTDTGVIKVQHKNRDLEKRKFCCGSAVYNRIDVFTIQAMGSLVGGSIVYQIILSGL